MNIYDVLHDLIPFVQFKERKKNPWNRVAGLSLEIY